MASKEQINIFGEIMEERNRQDKKFGSNRSHTPAEWLMILGEEVGEVNKAALEAHFGYPLSNDYEGTPKEKTEHHFKEYRKELIQVAAVAVAMLESHDNAFNIVFSDED